MDDDVLVRVENVSKRFCRSLKRSLWYGLQDLGSEIGGRRHGGGKGLPQSSADVQLRPDEFWAVKDVSFELRRGECLGLIGRNGAGKTTLLRMLNGLIKPDTGSIEISGRPGALVALGAGFNPILTGRENIFINASVLGLSRHEISSKIEEIIDFSGIQEFIDSPVQGYSSGMQARLGFAIATATSPDILFLDEVLAVGDAQFRYKCYNKIARTKSRGGAILVSHNMEQIGRSCERCIVLDKGTIAVQGKTSRAITFYDDINRNESQPDSMFEQCDPPVTRFFIKPPKEAVWSGDSLLIEASIASQSQAAGCLLKTVFYTPQNTWAAESILCLDDYSLCIPKGDSLLEWKVEAVTLRPGIYPIGVMLISPDGKLLAWSHKKRQIRVKSDFNGYHSDCIMKSTLVHQ